MLFVRACKTVLPAIALASALIAVPAFASRAHRSATSGHTKTAKKKNASHQIHGQREIEPERAKEIQSALIREHYLSGEPSGEWDAESQTAMSKFQADQGWQTKITPDSRALIKLGLGPTQETSALPNTNSSVAQSAIPAQPSMAAGSGSLLGAHSSAQ